MHPTEADLSPDERRRDIAAIFAAGILRLTTRPTILPGHADSSPRGRSEKLSDSGQNSLDSGRGTSPHVTAG